MSRKPRAKTPTNLTQPNPIKRGYTIEELATVLVANSGRVYPSAKQLGMAASSLYERMEKEPKLKELAKNAREELLDMVEDKFREKVEQGDTAVLIFIAKTLGKERGYTERLELTGANGGNIPIVFKWSDEDDNGGHETS